MQYAIRNTQYVVVCPPRTEYFRVADLAAQNITARAERAPAQAQHRALRETLAACGAEVVALPELPGHPNSVFTQDTALVTPEGFIRLRMGLPARRGEEAWMATALQELGAPEVGRISPPGTVEGGDVILAGAVAFVGRSTRTNDAGVRQISALLARMGYEIRVVNVAAPSLHIGGVMSVVGERQVLACDGVFPTGFFAGFDVITVPTADFIGGNVIALGEGEVIAERRNTAAIAALTEAGFTVHPLDLSEFVKGSGGPSCLILLKWRGGQTRGAAWLP